MIFTDLRLQNYRSYLDSSFELDSGVNIIIGPNAVGKTNLLEAMMVSAVGKSFRARDRNLVNFDSQWARIDTHTSDNQTRVTKIVNSEDGKTIKSFEFDDKIYKKINDTYYQPVVLFQPDDLRLLAAEPSVRRNYLDELITQYTSGYDKMIANLSRVISQRNALLKKPNISEAELFAWDVRLCDIGSYIVSKRLELISEINELLEDIYESISSKKLKLFADYLSKTVTSNYSNNLMNDLKNNLKLDSLRGYTSRGPHRDDVLIMKDNNPLAVSASRGENRTLVLSLKIIELQILEQKTGRRPLLLLDDVFSELDGSRRHSLTKYLEKYQTLITTTDADVVLKNFTRSTHTILL